MSNETGKTRATLMHRRYGRHSPIHEMVLDVPLSSLEILGKEGEGVEVDEGKLLSLLPSHLLRSDPAKILLVLRGKGIRNPSRFRPWGKYFDSFSLFLEEVEAEA